MRTLIATLCVITADWKHLTVDPHHSRLPYLQIHLVLKFICDPQVNTQGASAVILGQVHGGRILKSIVFRCQTSYYKQVFFLWSM